LMDGFMSLSGSTGLVGTAGETLVIISGILGRFQLSETKVFGFL
jgi:hypothetical protein